MGLSGLLWGFWMGSAEGARAAVKGLRARREGLSGRGVRGRSPGGAEPGNGGMAHLGIVGLHPSTPCSRITEWRT